MVAGWVAVVVSGVLYARAFPPHDAWVLAWVALVPLLIAVRRARSTARAVGLAAGWAVAAAWGLNDWFPHAVRTYYLQPWWVGMLLFLGVSLCTAAPAFMLFAWCARALARTGALVRPLLCAAAWVAAELVRARVLRDPWALLGYSQGPVPAVIQIADVTGVYGIGFVVAAVNAALAECWLVRRRPAERRDGLLGVLAAVSVVLVALAYGRVALRRPEAAGAPARVAVVQANSDLGSQWRPEFYGMTFDQYGRLTLAALRERPAALVVWPESALTFFLEDEPQYRRALASLLRPSGAELVTGGVRREGHAGPYYNSTFLVSPAGEVTSRYDKLDLLPFAEYFPLGSLALLRRDFAGVRSFTPGAAATLLQTRLGPAGVVVCNESMFAEPARERVARGAVLLLALANDSWVGDPTYAEQALVMGTLRAVELRRYLVRASTSGPSAIVDPTGRVVERTAPASQATLVGEVRPLTGRTWYARLGDAFAGLCALATCAVALRSRRTAV